ncbi:MAG: ATP-binding protein [Bacteroidales bacterium]|nr:ATP-binding protein [Bacteroidales bacterium]
MKDLKASRGKYLIQRLIELGENETQDFKYAISDARKIARSISAFANNRGGCLLIGVKDNGAIAGVRNEEDVYVVEQAGSMYCDPPQKLTFDAFRTDGATIVIRATVSEAARRPVRVREADGSRRAYIRVADENIVAHPLMVRAWMNHRPQDDILDETAWEILDAVRNAATPLPPEVLPMLIHRSTAITNATVVRLVNLGLLSFTYVTHRFRLVAVPESELPIG